MRFSKLEKIHQNLLDIAIHLTVSLVIALFIYLRTDSFGHALIFFAAGVLIDLDHLIDYFIRVRDGFRLKFFLDTSYCKLGPVYLLLHSWELIAALFVFAVAFNLPGLFLFGLGLSVHLSIDNLQRRNLLAYFLVYRIANKFDPKVLFPEFS